MKSKTCLGLIMLLLAVAGAWQETVHAKKRVGPQALNTKLKAVDEKTALSVVPVSAREQAVIDEINLARTNPAAYLKFLEQFKQNYRGKGIHYPDGAVVVTIEGVAALDEAIAFMRLQKPLPPLELRAGMVRAAKDHLNDLVKTGSSGHRGSAGSTAGDRFSRYGTWADTLGEDIVYFSRDARDDVISLIIDDGTSNRGHRRNIFQSNFRSIGIALSPPLKTGTICVITFAGGYKDNATTNANPATPTATKF